MKLFYTAIILLFSMRVFAAAPTVPASNLYFATVDGEYVNLGWSAGNGAKRIIVCKAGGPVTFTPQNGQDYTANTIFGSGQQPLPGEFIIYNNPFTSFYLTGLSAATQYYFAIFEYNGAGATTEYLTTALTGNVSTVTSPSVQISNANFTTVTNNSVNFTWTKGDGTRGLVVMREGSAVNAEPVNSVQYNVSSVFGNGVSIGTGNYTVYASTGNSTAVTNLKPGTQYFFAFYEFNGSGQPQYKKPAYTTSVTTRSVPTIASSDIVFNKTDGKELGLTWTNGNGQRRIIVAKKGSNVAGIPADGTSYTANAVFGAGSQLGSGEYVVFSDNFNIANITGLDPASTYYFKIFEFDGTGANTAYLTASFASINGSTAVTPTTQASGITIINTATASLGFSLTAGNGRARMVVARKGAAVNFLPQDFTVYIANGNFGSGQDLGNGNFVVRNFTDESVIVQNLQANTTYHFAIFEYNGFNQPVYLAPAAVFSATTLTALPVKLSNWAVVAAGQKVKLQWTTSAENNSSQFVIERSADGIHFSSVAVVQAAGTSSTEKQYTKDDENPLPGKSNYRLKIVDKDGYTEYSAILTVVRSERTSVSLLRNPVQSELAIVNTAIANSEVQWQIVSAGGQVVKKGRLQAGTTLVNISAIAAGTYWLQLYNNNSKLQTLPFIRQ